MAVPSATRENQYGWLGKFPSIREWVGDRVVNNIALSDYAIKNKDFENTIGLDRNDIADDQLGIYKPIVQEFGRATATHPDELVWSLLARGGMSRASTANPSSTPIIRFSTPAGVKPTTPTAAAATARPGSCSTTAASSSR